MTPPTYLLLCAAGGMGAALRFFVDGLVKTRTSGTYPWGTALINISGSFLLGLVTGLALSAVIPGDLRLIVGTGFLGGYTTFSTASFETVRLAQEGRAAASATNGLGTLVAGVVASAAGFWVTSLP